MQIANRCAPVKIANSAENSILQALSHSAATWSSLYSLGTDPIGNAALLLCRTTKKTAALPLLQQSLLRACALPSNVYGYARSVHVTIFLHNGWQRL
jgi:hypothetical protein